jgi:hypothetical protein
MLFASDRYRELEKDFKTFFDNLVNGGKTGRVYYDSETDLLWFNAYGDFHIALGYGLRGGELTNNPSDIGELSFVLKRFTWDGEYDRFVAIITDLHEFIRNRNDDLKDFVEYIKYDYLG